MSDDTWCEVHQLHHPPRAVPWSCRPGPTGPPVNLRKFDRVVVPTAGWSPVDEHDGDDADVIARASVAAHDLAFALDVRVPAALRLMRLWGDDTLGATNYNPSGKAALWCRAHDRDTRECERLKLVCTGDPYHPGQDPTGWSAAVHVVDGHDEAVAARRLTLSIMERISRDVWALAKLAEDYVSQLGEETPDLDPQWCVSCMRLQKCEPIALHKDGRARYTDLCRWCGPIASAEKVLPPLPCLRAHHEGRKVTAKFMRDELRKIRSKRSRRRSAKT